MSLLPVVFARCHTRFDVLSVVRQQRQALLVLARSIHPKPPRLRLSLFWPVLVAGTLSIFEGKSINASQFS